MADFVQTMKDWRRMCETIQTKNQQCPGVGWCKGCSLQGLCVIDTEVKDSTDSELSVIGDKIQAWAAEHPEPVYSTWAEWLDSMEVVVNGVNAVMMRPKMLNPIPANIAEKLGLQPKEG